MQGGIAGRTIVLLVEFNEALFALKIEIAFAVESEGVFGCDCSFVISFFGL